MAKGRVPTARHAAEDGVILGDVLGASRLRMYLPNADDALHFAVPASNNSILPTGIVQFACLPASP